jgi:hypothetical protein
MNSLNVTLTYLRACLGARSRQLRRDQHGNDRGASAVELAIITAVVLGIAAALLIVIQQFVQGEQSQIHG